MKNEFSIASLSGLQLVGMFARARFQLHLPPSHGQLLFVVCGLTVGGRKLEEVLSFSFSFLEMFPGLKPGWELLWTRDSSDQLASDFVSLTVGPKAPTEHFLH